MDILGNAGPVPAWTSAPGERRLVAAVHSDVVGYSRLVELDDVATSARLTRLRADLIEPLVNLHGGRVVNTAGDAVLMTFDSAAAAVAFAVEMQGRVPGFDGDRPPGHLIRLRVGISIADVVLGKDDLCGEGVNIAARLEAACPPGGVCVSRAVLDHVRNRMQLPFARLGALNLKNISYPVEAFVLSHEAVATAGLTAPRKGAGAVGRRWRWPVAATLASVLLAAALGLILRHGDPSKSQPDGGSDGEISIAVLPFINLSGDAEQAYLADGISEDLTTDLSRFGGATVIARESAFSYKGKQVDVRDVGRQLGARYVIEGSVRKLGDAVRVNAQLVSAASGAHLWAERFDTPVVNLPAGMDGVVGRIGSALKLKAPAEPPARAQPGNAGSSELVLRARSIMNEPPGEVRDVIARGLYEQALRADPASVPAMAGVASLLLRGTRTQLARAAGLVARAEAAAPNAPEVLVGRFLLLRATGRWAESVKAFRHLLDVDSSAAGVAAEAGMCPLCWGAPDEAIPLLERTIRLNPRSPNIQVLQAELGRMFILVGRDQEAVSWLLQAASPKAGAAVPGGGIRPYSTAQLLLAAAQALAGQVDDARLTLAAVLQRPDYADYSMQSERLLTPDTRDPERRVQEQRVIEGLRRAGLRGTLDEAADSGVPSDSQLRDLDKLDSPTPMTLPGGAVILTGDLWKLLERGTPLVLTTSPANPTVPRSIFLPISFGGSTDDEWQGRLERVMSGLTGGDRHRAVVTFAFSINHWHARNLALRLVALGYDNVLWYRGGYEAWRGRGMPLAPRASLPSDALPSDALPSDALPSVPVSPDPPQR